MIRRSGRLLVAAALAGALASCGGGGDGSASQAEVRKAVADALASQAASVATPTPDVATPPSQAPVAQADTTTNSAPVDFAMPNFVGMNLQDAQDKVQTYGIFYSVSHDVLYSRMQVLDSNWKVCTQSPKAGTRIKGDASDYEGKFDFGSVKLTESCP